MGEIKPEITKELMESFDFEEVTPGLYHHKWQNFYVSINKNDGRQMLIKKVFDAGKDHLRMEFKKLLTTP